MSYKNIISEKLEQLDWLYSVRGYLPAKADTLDEMMQLAREAGVEVADEREWMELFAKILSGSLTPHGEAAARAKLNRLKARLVSECVKAGLLRRFREVPVAGLEDLEVEP